MDELTNSISEQLYENAMHDSYHDLGVIACFKKDKGLIKDREERRKIMIKYARRVARHARELETAIAGMSFNEEDAD